MAIYKTKLSNILYDWQLAMANSVFVKHIHYTSDRWWTTRVRLVHSWAASIRCHVIKLVDARVINSNLNPKP